MDATASSEQEPEVREQGGGGDDAPGEYGGGAEGYEKESADGTARTARGDIPDQTWEDEADVEPLLPPPGREGLAGVVGANIRYEAVRYELTQDDLAQAIGRSRAAVSARYTGKVAWTLVEVGKIAQLMGLPPAELVTQAHPPTRYNAYW